MSKFICGGGFTDKYGITWDSVGEGDDEVDKIEDVQKYSPRICALSSSREPSDPPEIEQMIPGGYEIFLGLLVSDELKKTNKIKHKMWNKKRWLWRK